MSGQRTSRSSILNHFSKVDKDLVKVLEEVNFEEWFESEILDDMYIFKSLCRTIVGQQLAGKAAEAIFKRFENLFGGKVTTEEILRVEDQLIREAGLSWAKVRSVKDLATRVKNKELILENLESLSDEDLVFELSKVKGIGRWTAEMFLMFRLAREDIFSWGDLGLKNGLKKYMNKSELSMEEMEKIVCKWKPFRTYGAVAMWHLLDNR